VLAQADDLHQAIMRLPGPGDGFQITVWTLVGFLGVLMVTGHWFVLLGASRHGTQGQLPTGLWLVSLAGSSLCLLYFLFGASDSVGVLAFLLPMVLTVFHLISRIGSEAPGIPPAPKTANPGAASYSNAVEPAQVPEPGPIQDSARRAEPDEAAWEPPAPAGEKPKASPKLTQTRQPEEGGRVVDLTPPRGGRPKVHRDRKLTEITDDPDAVEAVEYGNDAAWTPRIPPRGKNTPRPDGGDDDQPKGT
jgi:lipid-A-disaccharide synthase-like uncharacterized protein